MRTDFDPGHQRPVGSKTPRASGNENNGYWRTTLIWYFISEPSNFR
jgi:hypothetical protein